MRQPRSRASAQPLKQRGLPPVVPSGARVLVLGSMPGLASLSAGAYYAHPRNAFWPILGALLGFDPTLPYPQRLARLAGAGIALWDVVGACRRRGSLDAAIDPASIEFNDIAGLLAMQPSIHVIVTNGGTASRLYRRRIAPTLPRTLAHVALPSTSPAHAGLSVEAKRIAWREALRPWIEASAKARKS